VEAPQVEIDLEAVARRQHDGSRDVVARLHESLRESLLGDDEAVEFLEGDVVMTGPHQHHHHDG